jgi:hypothetical protein
MQAHIRAQHRWLVVERLPGYLPDFNSVEGLRVNVKGTELANLGRDSIDEPARAAHGRRTHSSRHRAAFAFLSHFGDVEDWIAGARERFGVAAHRGPVREGADQRRRSSPNVRIVTTQPEPWIATAPNDGPEPAATAAGADRYPAIRNARSRRPTRTESAIFRPGPRRQESDCGGPFTPPVMP